MIREALHTWFMQSPLHRIEPFEQRKFIPKLFEKSEEREGEVNRID